MKKIVLLLFCTILLTISECIASTYGVEYKKLNLLENNSSYKTLHLPNDSVKKYARISWSTNLLEWTVFAPNIGFEYDLKDPTLISCPSIYFQLSVRPGKERVLKKEDYHTNALYYVRARAEYRWHFRFNERKEQRKGLAKTAMWINEQVFTRPVYKSKKTAIENKIDSTVFSSIHRKEKMFPGRYYVGIYGEYANAVFRNKCLDALGIYEEGLKAGNMYSLGLSGGYDFPGFNYNQKRFVQWSVGASIGAVYSAYDCYLPGDTKNNPSRANLTKIFPFITELRVALNFRNTTISKKYWQPDQSVYTRNIEANRRDSIYMAALDSVLQFHPVVLQVHSVNGTDSSFVENIDKDVIVSAFQKQTGLPYLLPTQFHMLENTQTALNKKELSDNYYIEYFTTNRLRNYTDSIYTYDRRNLPFRVELAGRAAADSLKNSFVESLKQYYTDNNSRPVFYGEPINRDSIAGYISKETIAATFSRIWGHQLDTTMIRKLYVRRSYTDLNGTYSSYDSIITEKNINRRELYAMCIQFHPQVILNGEEEGVARFSVAMAGAEQAHEQYVKVGSFINSLANSGLNLRIQRPWNGKDYTFQPNVSKDEVMLLLSHYGLKNIDESIVRIDPSLNTYTSARSTADSIWFHFGVTENDLVIPFQIEDSVGKVKAQSLLNDTILPWRNKEYWDTRLGLFELDPKVPGYFDEKTNQWYVDKTHFITAVKSITSAALKHYQIDDLLYSVSENPMRTEQYMGMYRAQARIIFHRELLNNRGEVFSITLPYLIVPTKTKEEAGFTK